MIRFQAKDYIPVPIEEIELDYIVLDEKIQKTENSLILC